MKTMNAFSRRKRPSLFVLALLFLTARQLGAQTYVYLTEVPDYTWYAGCFGTACGNLLGFWDRHGLPDFYTGPAGGGVAPLDTCGSNLGIRSMWASKAGLDGRPANKPGHIDDYWRSYTIDLQSCGLGDHFSYEDTAPDPYVSAGRPEHTPDCVGDFIGLSQNKWTNLANECSGNIDAYSFVFWDKTGRRRNNYYQTNPPGVYIPDIQSGLKEWARYRGYDADVFTQLTDFNPERTTTTGFTYDDVKAEIDAGYPVLCFLQPTTQFSRNLAPMPNANPDIHGVMIYGYITDSQSGVDNSVVIRTSWGSGDRIIMQWSASNWLGLFPVRGVIGFHPKPKVTRVARTSDSFTISWDGPSSQLRDEIAGTTTDVHHYQVERSTTLNPAAFKAVGSITTGHTMTLPDCCDGMAFYRVKLIP